MKPAYVAKRDLNRSTLSLNCDPVPPDAELYPHRTKIELKEGLRSKLSIFNNSNREPVFIVKKLKE